jgi:ATP-dependent helicase/nuclease subunit A
VARDERERAVQHESARLLYVALTRARDRLIVCGVESQASRFERSWYDFVSRAFDVVPSRGFALDGGGEGRRYGRDPVRAEASAGSPGGSAAPLPPWVAGLAPAEATGTRLSPSGAPEVSAGPSPSPLAAVGALGRYRRGDLIHRLLQGLPDLAPSDRAAAAARILGRERDLTDPQRQEMAAAARAVLEDGRFAAVFGPGSRAEVALAGGSKRLPLGHTVAGRVDRLIVQPGRVLVVDFKTNRPAPDRIEAVAPAYVRQMALYVAVLGEIYPDRAIEAALVWTDGPRLMAVPEALIEATLSTMHSARRSELPDSHSSQSVGGSPLPEETSAKW